jgi:hypothetical protein
LRVNSSAKQIIKLKKGEPVEQTFETDNVSFLSGVTRLEITTLVCDEPFAKYYNMYNGQNYGDISDPYTEPTITYSNLSNGIGVMASTSFLNMKSFSLK